MALKAARFANLFLVGVLTGNEFGSWAGLHPALRELPHQAHVRSEQAVTRRSGKMMPALMMGALVSFVPVLSLVSDRRSSSFLLGLAGMHLQRDDARDHPDGQRTHKPAHAPTGEVV
jgi:hypothetical protein